MNVRCVNFVMCCVHFVVCCMHFVVSCMHFVVSCVHFVVCCVHFVVSCVHFVMSCVHFVVCCVHFGECAGRHALLSQVTNAERATSRKFSGLSSLRDMQDPSAEHCVRDRVAIGHVARVAIGQHKKNTRQQHWVGRSG